MAEQPEDFLLNTLKGKVWFAVVTLAVTNSVISVIAFFGVTFITPDSLMPVLAAVLGAAVTTIVFAWLMSNSLMRPIEKLTLLAKGIERTPGMSLPKTTGSFETDEILHTISRTSHQLVNFIDLMDDVTAGKTDAAINTLEHSDRISAAFQKLVAKVTDSIDAKKELGELQSAVDHISSEVVGLHRGDLIQVRSDFEATKPISDALRLLIGRQSDLTRGIQINSGELRSLTSDGKKQIRAAIEKDEARKRQFKTLISEITDANTKSGKSTRDLSNALGSINNLLDQLNEDSASPAENAKSLAAVRKQFDAAALKLHSVDKQSLAIAQAAKLVQDLARRSNIIALNTSIQANSADQASGLPTLTQEITSLSERAEKANKAISGISESVVRDINEAHASLQLAASEVAKLSDQASKNVDSVAKIMATLTHLADLPANLDRKAIERSADIERTLQILEDCSARSDEVSAELESCETNYLRLLEPLENLCESVGPPAATTISGNGNRQMPNLKGQQGQNSNVQTAELLEFQGDI